MKPLTWLDLWQFFRAANRNRTVGQTSLDAMGNLAGERLDEERGVEAPVDRARVADSARRYVARNVAQLDSAHRAALEKLHDLIASGAIDLGPTVTEHDALFLRGALLVATRERPYDEARRDKIIKIIDDGLARGYATMSLGDVDLKVVRDSLARDRGTEIRVDHVPYSHELEWEGMVGRLDSLAITLGRAGTGSNFQAMMWAVATLRRPDIKAVALRRAAAVSRVRIAPGGKTDHARVLAEDGSSRVDIVGLHSLTEHIPLERP